MLWIIVLVVIIICMIKKEKFQNCPYDYEKFNKDIINIDHISQYQGLLEYDNLQYQVIDYPIKSGSIWVYSDN